MQLVVTTDTDCYFFILTPPLFRDTIPFLLVTSVDLVQLWLVNLMVIQLFAQVTFAENIRS